MENMESIIPVLHGNYETKRIYSVHAAESKNLTFFIKIINETTNKLLSINKQSGDLHLSITPGKSDILAEIVAKDFLNATASTYIKITTIPVLTCNEEILKNLCFWSKVTYQFKATSSSTLLGPLAPKSDVGGCHIKNISYLVITGTDFLKVYPPDDKTKLWMLGIKENFTKGAIDSKLYANISCVLETNDFTMAHFKLIAVNVFGGNSSSIEPQEKTINVKIHGFKIKKGHVIDPHNIFFLDKNPMNDDSYDAFIDNKNVSDFLVPNCTLHLNGTSIRCRIFVTKTKIFKNDISFLLGLKKRNYGAENHTGHINITLSFGNSNQKRTSNIFKNDSKIFRTAAPYTRVTQPYEYIKNMMNYQVVVNDQNENPFQITTEGIVYVYNFMALRHSPEHLRLNITWLQNNITHYEEVHVRIVDEPSKTCLSVDNLDTWTFCSHFKNQKNCIEKDACALGTGGPTSVETRNRPQRCMWRGDKKPESHETHLYSTCTPDITYCPDGVCDSLEALLDGELLCPQDCTKTTMFPTKLNEITGQGVDKCNGILTCDMGCSCNLRNSLLPSTQQPKKLSKIVEKKCGMKCIIGTVGGVVICVSIIGVVILFWRMNYVKKLTREKYKNNTPEAETPFSDYIDRSIINEPLVVNFHMSSALDNTNLNHNGLKINEVDPKWEFPRNQICIEQILGEGEFGKVLKAKAFNIAGRPGYSLVAVKTLKNDARKQDYSDLFSEYQLLKEVSHPHVIQLLGVCSKDGPLYIIIEYARYGSLRNYLRRSRHILTNSELANTEENLVHKVTPRDILSFARQITSGMSYLSDIKLVHRDLAARNILLAENKVCKISDFGLTRDIYEDNAYFKKSKGRVPVKWMAPESLADHVYKSKSDVWSFGILLWELITLGASPYPGIPLHNLYNLLKEGYRMEKPSNCSTVLYSLMLRCWNIDPEDRPSFLDLYHCFDNLLTDNMNYLDLSDNAVGNKSYFSMETDADSSPSENINIETYSHYKDVKKDPKEINNCLGYETPVKSPRRVKTATNERFEEEYTDMNIRE